MALNPLVSLFGRLVARSGRIRGNRQTDAYSNPRCACAPRVTHGLWEDIHNIERFAHPRASIKEKYCEGVRGFAARSRELMVVEKYYYS